MTNNERWNSKFLLPEHAQVIVERSYHVHNYRGDRPELDEQEREEIMRVLMESLGRQTAAKFRLYDPYEECVVVGVPYARTFTVESDRFNMADIIGANRF